MITNENNFMKRLLFCLTLCLLSFCLLAGIAAAAPPSGKTIVLKALNLSAAIHDYTADVMVSVDMPGVKMPARQARVYFKRPDKVAIDSKGIVMIPKRALMPGNLGAAMTADTQVKILGKTMQAGVPVYSLEVSQTGKMSSSDRLLLWVRGDRFTVERMQMQSGGQIGLDVSWEYQGVGGKYWLPKRMVATVAGHAIRRHHHIFTPNHSQSPTPESNKPGTVTVQFTNFRVNTGLSDKLFEQKGK
jgi:outer membrane lipoprotein-sorting protein